MSDHLPLLRRAAAGLTVIGAVLMLAGISLGRSLRSNEVSDALPATYAAIFLLSCGPVLFGHGGLLLRAFDQLLHRRRHAASEQDPALVPALRGAARRAASAVPWVVVLAPPLLVALATLVWGLGGDFLPGAIGRWQGGAAAKVGAEALVQVVAIAVMMLISATALVALRVPGRTLASMMLGLAIGTVWTPWYLAALVASFFAAS